MRVLDRGAVRRELGPVLTAAPRRSSYPLAVGVMGTMTNDDGRAAVGVPIAQVMVATEPRSDVAEGEDGT